MNFYKDKYYSIFIIIMQIFKIYKYFKISYSLQIKLKQIPSNCNYAIKF